MRASRYWINKRKTSPLRPVHQSYKNNQNVTFIVQDLDRSRSASFNSRSSWSQENCKSFRIFQNFVINKIYVDGFWTSFARLERNFHRVARIITRPSCTRARLKPEISKYQISPFLAIEQQWYEKYCD